jgi:hypothetical protein
MRQDKLKALLIQNDADYGRYAPRRPALPFRGYGKVVLDVAAGLSHSHRAYATQIPGNSIDLGGHDGAHRLQGNDGRCGITTGVCRRGARIRAGGRAARKGLPQLPRPFRETHRGIRRVHRAQQGEDESTSIRAARFERAERHSGMQPLPHGAFAVSPSGQGVDRLVQSGRAVVLRHLPSRKDFSVLQRVPSLKHRGGE